MHIFFNFLKRSKGKGFAPHLSLKDEAGALVSLSRKKSGGFSIIEFLIYIAILSIAVAAMGLVSSNVFRVGVRNDVVQEVSHNGRFAMQRIGQTIWESSEILLPETEGNELELSFGEISPAVIFNLSEGKLIMREGEKDYEITTSKVVVNSLVFKKVSEDSVRVEMSISFNNQDLPEYDFKSFFASSFTLKN